MPNVAREGNVCLCMYIQIYSLQLHRTNPSKNRQRTPNSNLELSCKRGAHKDSRPINTQDDSETRQKSRFRVAISACGFRMSRNLLQRYEIAERIPKSTEKLRAPDNRQGMGQEREQQEAGEDKRMGPTSYKRCPLDFLCIDVLLRDS